MTDTIDPAWPVAAELPRGFTPSRILPTGAGALVPGWSGTATTPATERRATILAVSVGSTVSVTVQHQGPGWIVDADLLDDATGAAIVIEPAADPIRRTLLWTEDGGVTWQPGGTIDAPSASSVLVTAPGRAWVTTTGGYVRTTDHGKSWSIVDGPGARLPSGERLFAVRGRVLLATSDGTFVTRDEGATWGRRPLGGAHVRAVDGPFIAATRGDHTLVGQPRQDQVRWFVTIRTPIDPVELRVASPRVQLLATLRDPDDRALLLIESDDDGQTLTTTRLGVPPTRAWAALSQDGAVYAIDLDRALRVKRCSA